MVNKIGALELPNISGVPSASISGNTLNFDGYFETRIELTQLQEMFRKAEGGTTIHTLIGGNQIGFDTTEGAVLTQYCEFDADHIKNGYYLLRSLNCNFEQYDSYYPFSITLFFLGTTSYMQSGFMVYGLEEVDNDWNI